MVPKTEIGTIVTMITMKIITENMVKIDLLVWIPRELLRSALNHVLD
jgi:hypothetical protein